MTEKGSIGRLETLDFDDAAAKRAYNRRLFDVVAPAYPRVTAALSFGQDRRWKETLVSWLPAAARPVCVDVASGTGDFLPLLRRRYPDGRILGMDLNREMMTVGKGLGDGRETATFILADMSDLPLPDETVDIVTAGYALRNAPDLTAALKELVRVLRPGGTAAILDFSKPPSRTASRAAHRLLEMWGRLWGAVFHRDGDVYGYIAESLSHFPDREALTAALTAAGLDTVRISRPFLGFLELRLVRKQRRHSADRAEGNGLHGEVAGE